MGENNLATNLQLIPGPRPAQIEAADFGVVLESGCELFLCLLVATLAEEIYAQFTVDHSNAAGDVPVGGVKLQCLLVVSKGKVKVVHTIEAV